MKKYIKLDWLENQDLENIQGWEEHSYFYGEDFSYFVDEEWYNNREKL